MRGTLLNPLTGRGLRAARAGLLAAGLLLCAGLATAKTLRVAVQGDATSMDPHALSEAVQLSFTGNIFEPLVTRDRALKLVPGLATAWTRVSPTVWRFELRREVRFHDGSPFTAADVVFSIDRARGEGSDMRTQLASVREVRRKGDFGVEIVTHAPNPILPDLLTTTYIMSRAWAQANRAEHPVDRRQAVESAAAFKANGTGPYKLRSRQPGVSTVLERNAGHWAPAGGNVTEVVFQPLANDATRLAALASGQVDLIDPVPLQDIARVRANPALRLAQAPETRIIFLGFDQQRDELLYASVKGRNPFKDRRVRQAFYQAIDVNTIVDKILRQSARPAALMVAEGMRGHTPALDQRLPYDPEAAKRLLAEAGYPQGFELTLNCPSDRYINDAEICQAVAANLARVGIKLRLQVEPKATYFSRVLKRDTSFFMAGWSPAGFDALHALYSLVATPAGAQGQWNLGAYSNARIDTLIGAVQTETDLGKRTALMQQALQLHRDDIGHVPLHQQMLSWGMRANVDAPLRADNFMVFDWVTIR